MKFFISAMIEKTEIFNNKTMEFEPCNKYLHNPCGTDYGLFVNDLKTLKGLEKRIRKMSFRKDVKELHIFSYYNQFDDNSYRLLKTITNFNKMSF